MIWSSAQTYCRENYVDLATVTSQEENQKLLNAARAFTPAVGWIGLNRTAPLANTWQWSDGEPTGFFNWLIGEPNNQANMENCGMVRDNGFWNDDPCQSARPFYCSGRFVLVKDNQTWEQALHYCRTYHTGLASPVFPGQRTQGGTEIAQTQTVRVWTGVRFVNGQWVSVSRVPLGNLVSLSSCPAPGFRCGALNTKTYVWENRDCNEKLNVLCYRW